MIPGDDKNTGADEDVSQNGDANPDMNIDIDGNIQYRTWKSRFPYLRRLFYKERLP